MSDRELLDDDGENLALRTFLAFYGNNPTATIGAMKDCMETSGWDNHPEFVTRMPDWSMTKAAAQIWIRHLLSLEQALSHPERELAAKRITELEEEIKCEERRFNELWDAYAKLAQPKQKLIGWKDGDPQYAAPPHREWVDLTDDEIEDVRRKTFMAFQDAIAGRGSGKLDTTNYAKNLIDAFKEKNR